jgi:hypothetical protein
MKFSPLSVWVGWVKFTRPATLASMRVVAIKVLPDHLADRTEVRERFDREARAISSLIKPMFEIDTPA